MAALLVLAFSADDKDTAFAFLLAIPLVSAIASRLALALIGCLAWTSLRRA
jgi:hypothetical protein